MSKRYVKSRSLFKPVADVFRYTSADEKAMHVQMARLCVLSEDLEIEWTGADAHEIAELDKTDLETRRFYFVRRTLATLTEIESAFTRLNMNPEFKTLKGKMPKEALTAWDDAIKFFSTEHAFLKDWRNDIGGHFQEAASTYAVDNVEPATVGVIEIYRRGKGADCRMPFAYQLVAVAMTKNKGAQQTVTDFLERAFTFLGDAMYHARTGIQILTNVYILQRFK